MNLFQLFKNVGPFVKPYKWLVFITLVLTLIGSLMAQVNAIVHPTVMDDFQQWKSRQDTSWVGIESAILYESNFAHLADKVIAVYAPEQLRIARACRRDNAPAEAIRQRIARQMKDEEKCKLADFTLYNDDNHPLLPQILDILANLLCLSRK